VGYSRIDGALLACPHVHADEQEPMVAALWRPHLLSCRRAECVDRLFEGRSQQLTCDRCQQQPSVQPITAAPLRLLDREALVLSGLCYTCAELEGNHQPYETTGLGVWLLPPAPAVLR
jgi:hypothetical protein